MSKIKMVAPVGLSGMSVAGTQIDVVDGFAMVDEIFVEDLKPHGFTVFGETAAAGSRADRIQLIVTGMRTVAEQLSDDDLMAFASKSDVDRAVVLQEVSDVFTTPAVVVTKVVPTPVDPSVKK